MTNEIEIWVDLLGYEGIYKISNIGNIISLDRMVNTKNGKRLVVGKKLKYFTSNCGYQIVELSNSTRKKYLVHRLVAKNFILNTKGKKQVNHKNGLKTDNRVDNLEWSTAKENSEHAINHGLSNNKGINHGACKLTEDQVLLIKYGLKKMTQKQIAINFSVNKSRISSIRTGRSWKHI